MAPYYQMKGVKTYLILLCLTIQLSMFSQTVVHGHITDSQSQLPVAEVQIRLLNSNYSTKSSASGDYTLVFPSKKHLTLVYSCLSYQKRIKEVDVKGDSLLLNITLTPDPKQLDSVVIKGNYKPETLVWSPKYSIYDFDFYEDKYILLTSEGGMDKAELRLADQNGKTLHSVNVGKEAGLAKELYHDYMGYTNLVCEKAIYRINIHKDRILTWAVDPEGFNAFIKPVIDTVNNKLIFSDHWKDYPSFNYFNYNPDDSSRKKIITITNEDLMKLYNMEYYYLKPAQKLEARQLAEAYKADKHVIAALMSGFTKSLYYDPLYAPLFILKDTLCVFDHYKDQLIHFDKKGNRLDSVTISYNHPKNWREWSHLMVKDDIGNSIYAIYNKNGHKYLKQIDHNTGKEIGKYNLQQHSAEKIKVRDGYAYYVYRPFESTQEKFLYRELIR